MRPAITFLNIQLSNSREHLVNMGEARLGKLINLLLQNNRIEDVKKASVDKEARKKFYKEFGIID